MNTIRIALPLLALAFSGLVSAGTETQQYCNEMYPADSYEAADRALYIQECLQAYGENEAAEEPMVEDLAEEPVYYEGTVEEYIEEQPEEPIDY